MPRAEFFSLFRLFVVRNFFDGELCRKLREEMRAASGTPGTARGADGSFTVDPLSRRVTALQVSDATVESTTQRLLALQPRLEKHFGVRLAGLERPQFLSYEVGDHYLPHRDSSSRDVPEATSQRAVSVVVFLSSQARESSEEGFAGGSLTFYGLLGDARGKQAGLPLEAETGLLVAFPSGLCFTRCPPWNGETGTR